MSTRLFQPKAQHAARVLGGGQQLAAGGLAEMLEILDRARVGGEDFEDAAGRHITERPPRLEHRQRAQQPRRVEGRIGWRVAHYSTSIAAPRSYPRAGKWVYDG